MLCRLCFYECSEETAVALFNNGEEYNLTKLIAKYMYLEVKSDDIVSTKICNSCFQHLNAFHEFFQYVENRQNEFPVLSDALALNLENKTQSMLKAQDALDEQEDLLEKLQPSDEFDYANTIATTDDFNQEDDNDDDTPLKLLLSKGKLTDRKNVKRKKHKTDKLSVGKIRRIRKKGTKKDLSAEVHNSESTESIVKKETNDESQESSNSVDENIAKLNRAKENQTKEELIAKHVNLKCDVCQVSTTSYKALRTHFRTEHINITPYVVCCGRRFWQRCVLLDHIEMHTNPAKFSCNICGKLFQLRATLYLHKTKVHSRKEKLKFVCIHCRKRFAHQSNLDDHMLSHKLDEGKHICEFCQKAFQSVHMLKVHVGAIHEDRTPKICDICGKLLMPNTLRRHMMTHNVQDIKCETCGKLTKSKSALASHIKYWHSNAPMFPCTFCDRTFKRHCVLQEHIAMHTGAKDYNCPHCTREFRSKANMYAHIKRDHGEQWAQKQSARNYPMGFSIGLQ